MGDGDSLGKKGRSAGTRGGNGNMAINLFVSEEVYNLLVQIAAVERMDIDQTIMYILMHGFQANMKEMEKNPRLQTFVQKLLPELARRLPQKS